MNYKLLTILVAYLLDICIGDPQWVWHPVRIIGRLIVRLEEKLNIDTLNKLFTGVILVILVVGLSALCVWGILKLAEFVHQVLYYVISALCIYFALSVKSLAVEANRVYKALEEKNIEEARNSLSMIVGRDTQRLNEPEVIRASVEIVAESIMDGIVAPLFYIFIGGPVLGWTYKAINTLDSMVGYRSERFIEFGKASATLDGLANLIPAKITCILIGVSGWLCRKDGFNSIKWTSRYFFKGPEFNSIATEAAMAGALKVQLGGLNFYNSQAIFKPLIGDNIITLDIRHIKDSIRIAFVSSILILVSGLSLIWILKGR